MNVPSSNKASQRGDDDDIEPSMDKGRNNLTSDETLALPTVDIQTNKKGEYPDKMTFKKSKTTHDAVIATEEEPESAVKESQAGPVLFPFQFPEEVWLMILDKLEEDIDRENCCRASPYLDKLLTKSKPVWLFKKILPLYYSSLGKKADLLNSRRICKQWSTDIDTMIECKMVEQEFENFHGNYFFPDQAVIKRFLNHFTNQTRNPFIGRTVSVRISFNMPFTSLELLFELLRKFGAHIATLMICVDNAEAFPNPTQNWYRFLHLALSFTPNLKILGFSRMDGSPTVPYQRMDNNNGDLEILEEYMLRNPLPLLPSLETLVQRIEDVPGVVLNRLLFAGGMMPTINQLKILHMSMTSWKDTYPRGLTNLTKLQLLGIDSDQCLERLLKHPFSPRLERLHLNISSSDVHICKLLELICSIPNLTSVTLEFETGYADSSGLAEEKFKGLENSTVKKIEVIGLRHVALFSFNFLQIFKSLEYFVLGLKPLFIQGQNLKKNKREAIYRQLFTGDTMNGSRLWDVVPSLKFVRVFYLRGEPEERFDFRWRRSP